MGKTIKQLADALGVSKTAIRNYMDDDFRVKFTAKDDKGVITITPDGCKLISENIGKQAENTAKNNPETELLTIPRSVWQLMEEQIREKDEQLRVKDQQIADLTAAVKSQAQSINADRHTALAGTLQPMLESSNPEPSEQQKKPGFFARFRGR
jgi:ERCC4-related helicase